MRPTIDQWAFDVIETYAERGTCVRRKAACLALDSENRIVALGMNGVPRGFQHCIDFPCLGATDPAGDTSNCWAIHAEINMIINAVTDRSYIERVYVSTTPCKSCALMLANLPNLKEVHALTQYADQRGVEILEMASVAVIHGDPRLRDGVHPIIAQATS